jgi:hypothetical protein
MAGADRSAPSPVPIPTAAPVASTRRRDIPELD